MKKALRKFLSLKISRSFRAIGRISTSSYPIGTYRSSTAPVKLLSSNKFPESFKPFKPSSLSTKKLKK